MVHLFFNAVDCLDPTCSNNGICVNGECHCKPGWGGLHCELPRAQCPDQCHGHGAFIPDTGLCSCDPNWMGPDCSMGEFGCMSGCTAVISPMLSKKKKKKDKHGRSWQPNKWQINVILLYTKLRVVFYNHKVISQNAKWALAQHANFISCTLSNHI